MIGQPPLGAQGAMDGGSSIATGRVDFLSQILSLIQLRGERVFSADLSGPWALRFEPGPGYFHVVLDGTMQVEAEDGEIVHAAPGDLIVLSRGHGHAIGQPGAKRLTATDVLAKDGKSGALSLVIPGEGEPVRFITGAFRFEGDNLPSMLAVLPSMIHIARDGGAEGSAWLLSLAHHILLEAETPHPGAALMISRLIDVLVIRAMRIWIQAAPPEDRGWVGALADVRISRALKAIHDEPFHVRTVAQLAAIAGMSRSRFSERFAMLIGAAPLHYQTRWRLLLANDMLKRPGVRVSDVARRVGYDSDSAFSRAFKAQFGMPPGLVRN